MVYFFRSIKFKLILLILGLAMLQNGYFLHQSLRQAESRIEKEIHAQLSFQLEHLQENLRYFIEREDFLQVQKEFVTLGLDAHIRLGILVNYEDEVFSALRRADIGKPWQNVIKQRFSEQAAELISRMQAKFTQVRISERGLVRKSDDGSYLEAVYPVVCGTSKGSLRPDKIGVVLLWKDLSILKQAARQDLLKNSLGAIFVVLIGAIIILIMLHYWVVHPLNNLSISAQNLANRQWDYTRRLPTKRTDEMGVLGRAFANMSAELKELFNKLEQKVEERTVQLENAYNEITQLNQRLASENIRMGTELEVTRKLQQMVLPHEAELKQIQELDIACFMEPASEVGGDYYDVLQYNGQVQIGIGDVTGHGLESGVLMLMVQTAVRTLLLNNISDAHTFMSVLNRVIYDNVQRMHSDKNLTLSILNYTHGKLCLTGQHEEVLLVKKNATIQRIDTFDLGFMVGLEKDISPFIAEMEVELQEGDGIVLYTDGITEARQGKQEYGLDRLCRIIQTHWDQSAQAVLEAVVDDVRTFINNSQLQDDITLLVIKKTALNG